MKIVAFVILLSSFAGVGQQKGVEDSDRTFCGQSRRAPEASKKPKEVKKTKKAAKEA